MSLSGLVGSSPPPPFLQPASFYEHTIAASAAFVLIVRNFEEFLVKFLQPLELIESAQKMFRSLGDGECSIAPLL